MIGYAGRPGTEVEPVWSMVRDLCRIEFEPCGLG